MNLKEFLRPDKKKVIILLIMLLISFPLYFHSTCINMYVEPKLFGKPSICGLLLPEFLICCLINYIISCLIVYGYEKFKGKKK